MRLGGGKADAMNGTLTNRARAQPEICIKIGKKEECWKTLSTLIAKRASAIHERRAGTAEEGIELWKLAESQVEKPLCCGILKLTGGWLISFNSVEMGASELEICAEPRRLILLGRNPKIGGVGSQEPVVRVLRLPEEVDPASVKVIQEGPILDIELRAAATAKQAHAAAHAA